MAKPAPFVQMIFVLSTISTLLLWRQKRTLEIVEQVEELEVVVVEKRA